MNFFRPGIEVKFACEEAEKCGAQLDFLGAEYDQRTWRRLMHETRNTVFNYLWNSFVYMGYDHWAGERKDLINKVNNSEPAQFTEQCLDQYQINWFIQSMAVFFPHLKTVHIDKRDNDLFQQIDQSPH